VLFSPHDLLGDPPFSRMDLISCRNLLIYLQRSVQRDVLELFHYCLAPDGFLVLGTSESTDASRLFDTEDREHRIYRRRTVAAQARIPLFPLTRTKHAEGVDAEASGEPAAAGALHQRMVEWFAPPSVLVGADDSVVHVSENAGRFLVHPGGEPATNILSIVRPELRLELRFALHAARRAEGTTVDSRPVTLVLDGENTTVVLRVRQAPASGRHERYALVVFDEQRAAVERPDATDEGRDVEIASEMAAADRRMHAVVADYEAVQQQLRSANEELQSSNEELRATLEELETNKEELQSVNEELHAVNEENRHKVEELAQLSSDLQNLLVATDIATLFLDRQLRIVRYTPKLAELFSIRPADHGRAITDLTHRLGYPDLVADATEVLERLTGVEGEVRDERGRWYLNRLLPYRTTDDRIEGVVITFVDITERRLLEDEVRAARKFAEDIIESTREPFLVLDPDLRVHMANPAFLEHFEVDPDDTVGRYIFELGNGQWDIPALRELLEDVLPNTTEFENYEIDHVFEDLGRRTMVVNARQLDHIQLILLGINDITEFRLREEELREARETAEQAGRAKSEFLSTMSHELRTPLSAVIGLAELVETEVVGSVNPAQKEHLGRIRDAAWNLVSLIDDILSFARSEAGQEQLRIREADIAEVARNVVNMLNSSRLMNEREIDLAGADQVVPASTDAGKVRQILTNLVGNAIKYGVGTVDVVLDPTEEWFEVRVSDEGPGIPPDLHESIFDPFDQGDPSGSLRGTGLGLTISRRLARMLGGDVTVESAAGQGSTFTLRLPRTKPADAAPLSSPARAASPGVT
jgi:two-component system, chemotaxis family, CheB/CheR fusion protein